MELPPKRVLPTPLDLPRGEDSLAKCHRRCVVEARVRDAILVPEDRGGFTGGNIDLRDGFPLI
eukprot:1595136-Pyramimonas_sp.AAC.1